MNITTIKPGWVEITSDPLDENDLIEYAEALIEAFGWHPGTRDEKDPLFLEGKTNVKILSNEENGFTLHDALGEAGNRLNQDTGKGGSLREPALAKVQAAIPGRKPKEGIPENVFNNKAKNKDEIIAVLQKARAS